MLLACVCLTTVCCQNSKKKNTPEAVTEAFAKSFYTADFTHMYQYTTKKSHIVIQNLQKAMNGQPERLEKMNKQQVVFVETKMEAQTDSTASCFCHVTIDGQPRTDKWDLLKEEDEWKVTLVLP